MLTTGHVDYFRTFGFTVLRGHLANRVTTLRAEVDTAIRDAYATTYDERVIDGISGHYLPMASRLTPVSTSLVCDDPPLIDAAEQLLGGPVIPGPGRGSRCKVRRTRRRCARPARRPAAARRRPACRRRSTPRPLPCRACGAAACPG